MSLSSNFVEKAEVAVAMPGRLLDHIRRRSIRLDIVRFFVLDEVDKMFDMGFVADVEVWTDRSRRPEAKNPARQSSRKW